MCRRMAMLHNCQAPGRDFHKHFSLAPARSDTNPQATRNPPPLPIPIPYKTGLKLAMRRREQPTCHPSLYTDVITRPHLSLAF